MSGVVRDTIPQIAMAGKPLSKLNDGALACMRQKTPPRTPDGIRPFRKSATMEVGKTAVHHGKASDPRPPDMRFGMTNKQRETALECLQPHSENLYVQQKEALLESKYRSNQREPLGRSPSLGVALPTITQREDFKFGVKTVKSDSAGMVMYNGGVRPDIGCKEIHAPGEQKQRNYDWNAHAIEPTDHRFGFVAPPQDHGAKECMGVDNSQHTTAVLRSTVLDHKLVTHDELGKTKVLGFGSRGLSGDHVFGKPNRVDEWDAKHCIHGGYNDEEQSPDNDLGKTCTRSKRLQKMKAIDAPPHESRSFGCPTVRTDLVKPKSLRVTNNHNYGDDADARSLLYPSQFSVFGVKESSFLQPVTLEEVKAIAAKCNLGLQESEIDQAYTLAETYTSSGTVSIETFRKAVDDLGY